MVECSFTNQVVLGSSRVAENWFYQIEVTTLRRSQKIINSEFWKLKIDVAGRGREGIFIVLHIFPLLLCGDNVKNTACNQKRIFDPVKLRVKFGGKEIIYEIHRWNKIHHRCLTHSQTRLWIFTLDKAADWDQGFPCSNWSRPDFLLAHLNQKLMNSQSTALTYSLLNSL